MAAIGRTCLAAVELLAPMRAFSTAAPTSSAAPVAPIPVTIAAAASAASSSGPSTAPFMQRMRFKNAHRRASTLMSEIKKDAMERMNVRIAQRRPQLPNFRVGDAIQVSYALENSEKDSAPIRGTVMGKWKKGVDSKFAIVNNLDGEWYTATYTHASPLLRGVKILQRNRVNDGLKRARRAKLTNLLHADPATYQVNESTKEAAEVQKDKEARRAAMRAGKSLKKKTDRSQPGAKADAAAGGKGAAAGKGAAPAKAAAPSAKGAAKK